MTAFDRAWDIVKSVYHRLFSDEEIQRIANENQLLLQEPLDPDPTVNFPSECERCFSDINNIVEGIPKLCSKSIHPWVDKRMSDSMEIEGFFGDGKPFDLNQAIEDGSTVGPKRTYGIDYEAYRDRMGHLE